ncbi:MAG: hypothetical protein ACTSVZ_12265 [Promethearchaeota archaeon]
MNSITETEYEYILKINNATTFPIDSIPNWYLMRNKTSMKIGNLKSKKGSASQFFIKNHRKYYYTYHKVEEGLIFLSKEANRFRFESMTNRRLLQANKIMSWKQKSPNRTYTLQLEDRFDTDGKIKLISSQSQRNPKQRKVQISEAKYFLLYSPYRWSLISRFSPSELTLPRINSNTVCGLCAHFNYHTSQCRNTSREVLYCSNGCSNFSLRSTLI